MKRWSISNGDRSVKVWWTESWNQWSFLQLGSVFFFFFMTFNCYMIIHAIHKWVRSSLICPKNNKPVLTKWNYQDPWFLWSFTRCLCLFHHHFRTGDVFFHFKVFRANTHTISQIQARTVPRASRTWNKSNQFGSCRFCSPLSRHHPNRTYSQRYRKIPGKKKDFCGNQTQRTWTNLCFLSGWLPGNWKWHDGSWTLVRRTTSLTLRSGVAVKLDMHCFTYTVNKTRNVYNI